MKNQIDQTYQKIKKHILKTPLIRSAMLSQKTGANVFLKLENQQLSGSFKLRGALSKILSLTKEECSNKLVTASTGNHGAGFAYAIKLLDLDGKIFLPTTVTQPKFLALKTFGLPLELFGSNSLQTEIHAKSYANENGYTMVHPYNDPEVISGQGTIAIELLEQLKNIDSILVPIGGGGLISGIAAYMHAVSPSIRMIGCQPLHSPEMYESIKAGKIIEMESHPTLSDATAGGIEPNSITFGMCQKYVDDYIILNEDEIRAAILFMLEHHNILIEGGAALSVAAILKSAEKFKNKNVVLLITGKKISISKLTEILVNNVVK